MYIYKVMVFTLYMYMYAPYLVCVGPYWYPEGPAQSKVSQLDGSLLIN